MPIVTYILRDGSRSEIDVPAGTSVMEAAIHNNVRGIDAECGGCLSCATCHVYIDSSSTAELPEPDDTERELLEGVAAERRPESRLSCQLVVAPAMNGLVVQIPARQG
ncbi:2Fe-2S iron-sulfur cluster binding domain-containing protein [bacterium M00.F.Ca.ET.228.01.1.1]|uniref:2Fe-2S iron-sulfur cluster-binding protein n=1 Tax=Paraburkholderia phenoliruptrix TaxID=252970 RepID=UPI001092F6FE|nr:2Fe-2S iron-sulfur cluster-binding protein [Paraburkholderia phenoliruptrix]TGP47485.1 2Fe-2S iron-sulfur cluster binding domain-containing protein [bacterium M00.F.Ca.ET.228.01.1.1]TGS05278.1 2Fe-2S iron-sulfur cluster binding domain-containing protein [bacterium M00.F.Ca.ET.191.01.1.1]TGU10214.1 2Fe-2S iron-sulfur cluster binding domain-containing protein [bacterium M00.F.Ca.ET.155.01.1.1]MBW0445736.1 2Fe-2S iron-sulfur cluster binding domain-containing protein [Paraburkholderia phenolirup